LDVIRWGEDKNRWLRRNRGVSFDQIAGMILAGQYLDVLRHPSRTGQEIFVIRIESYTWAVPFVSDKDSIFLKTAFPSRKFHRRYGGSDAQDQTGPG
jgi:hypothetical protein